jgi:NADPH:quinone reductase-like Zn-dependent oxidoreductase
MKVMAIDGGFGLEQLKLVERPEPQAGPGELVLKMKAASLNYRDLLMVKGQYNPKQPLPLVPCSDGVGEVIATGEGVSRFAVGDRVAPIFAPEWISGRPDYQRLRTTLGGPLDGVLAEQMVVPESAAVKLPAYLTDEEAATLPCAALTAWTTLVIEGGLKAGDWVLIQGSGGVSIFALQLAKLFGARTIATSSSDAKLERMRELGADKALNYKETPKWGREVRKLADGRGVDLIVEVGGAQTLGESLTSVAMGGFIGLIGVLSGNAAPLNFTSVFMKYVRIQGILVGHRDGFEAMNRAFEAAELRPVVDKVFELEDSRAALEHLQSGAHFGKVCVRIA